MPLTNERAEELAEQCRQFRVDVLTAIHGAQSGHPGGSLSVCEILTLLYQELMNVDAKRPDDPDRDRLVLCKGHAAPMLYRNLIEKGFLPADSMATLRKLDSQLQGHPSIHTPGVEMPSGPLGIGLAAAQGMALGLKLNNSPARVFAVLGDGELNEGSMWESLSIAGHQKLNNLTVIVDRNGLQLDGFTKDIQSAENLAERFLAFGFDTREIDGHDPEAIDAALSVRPGRPFAILARTVKGRGVSFAENNADWHANVLTDELYEQARRELGVGA